MRSDEELTELLQRLGNLSELSPEDAADHFLKVCGSCVREEIERLAVFARCKAERSSAWVKALEAEMRRQKAMKGEPVAPLKLSRKGQRDPVLLEALTDHREQIKG
jgi:hypothetical protein